MTHVAAVAKRSPWAQTQSDTQVTCKAKGNIMASRLGKNMELYKCGDEGVWQQVGGGTRDLKQQFSKV